MTLTGHTAGVMACAIGPDANFVVSAGGDRVCRIWDAATGEERATLPLLGSGCTLALHQWRPFAACGDVGGGVYLTDLVGIEYGPVVVTAVDLGKRSVPAVRCPKCLQAQPLVDAWLGHVIGCPSCGLWIRVNPFITKKTNGNWRALGSTAGDGRASLGPRHWWSKR
jgi:WD40 repeat protein